jgi:hypothetical protein
MTDLFISLLTRENRQDRKKERKMKKNDTETAGSMSMRIP